LPARVILFHNQIKEQQGNNLSKHLLALVLVPRSVASCITFLVAAKSNIKRNVAGHYSTILRLVGKQNYQPAENIYRLTNKQQKATENGMENS